MPIAKKPTTSSAPFNAAEIVAAKAAASARISSKDEIDWNEGTLTPGGGVAATLATLRKTRGPNKKPAKEQVAMPRGQGAA
jgi:hypothetical protein